MAVCHTTISKAEEGEVLKVTSPNGELIVGTAERVYGTARIAPDSFARLDDGKLDFEYAGETDIGWDSQETVTRFVEGKREPERVFIDENDAEWLESELVVVEEG